MNLFIFNLNEKNQKKCLKIKRKLKRITPPDYLSSSVIRSQKKESNIAIAP